MFACLLHFVFHELYGCLRFHLLGIVIEGHSRGESIGLRLVAGCAPLLGLQEWAVWEDKVCLGHVGDLLFLGVIFFPIRISVLHLEKFLYLSESLLLSSLFLLV